MRNRGFTLIELLVSLTIFSIMLAIAVPNLSRWLERNKAKSFALDLASNINSSRVVAKKDGVRVILVVAFSGSYGSNLTGLVDIDPVYYFIFEDKNSDGSFDNGDKIIVYKRRKGCVKILSNSLSKVYKNSSGVAVGKALVFFPVGVPLIGFSNLNITIGCNENSDIKYSVLLNGINGIASVVSK